MPSPVYRPEPPEYDPYSDLPPLERDEDPEGRLQTQGEERTVTPITFSEETTTELSRQTQQPEEQWHCGTMDALEWSKKAKAEEAEEEKAKKSTAETIYNKNIRTPSATRHLFKEFITPCKLTALIICIIAGAALLTLGLTRTFGPTPAAFFCLSLIGGSMILSGGVLLTVALVLRSRKPAETPSSTLLNDLAPEQVAPSPVACIEKPVILTPTPPAPVP